MSDPSAAPAPAAEPRAAARPPAPPTPLSRRFVRYVVGFGVGVVLGLAPFLGTVEVPGFVALLDLFPLTLRERLVGLAPLVMGVVAVAVQFGAEAGASRRSLRMRFRVALVALAAGFLALVVLQTFLVEEVDVLGGERTARFAVGFTRPASCGCPPGLSDAECIAQLSLDPARVETCWGSDAVEASELALTLSYLLVIGGFGALVGLVLLQEAARRRR